jgi:molybdate transport system substrate-binding protein
MNDDTVNLLCAGAVQGLVRQLQPRFSAETGATLNARFGAVGAMKEALATGAPCDVMIVTDAMVVELQGSGALSLKPPAPLGRVRTGVAVRSGEPRPDIATPAALTASLRAARAVYFPDPQRATAGIHFASVLDRLGLAEELAPRLHTLPNGATAMRELANIGTGAIGCTQITEIMYTPGITLVGPLPDEFELATVYTAAVALRAAQPVLAQRFIDLLAGPATRALRADGGFEFD